MRCMHCHNPPILLPIDDAELRNRAQQPDRVLRCPATAEHIFHE
jgi:hypothetical protein